MSPPSNNYQGLKFQFDHHIRDVRSILEDYRDIFETIPNIEFLHRKLREEIRLLKLEEHENKESRNLNNRKSYYENQAMQSWLNNSKTVLYVYMIVALLYVVFVFFKEGSASIGSLAATVVVLILLPPLMSAISSTISKILWTLYSVLPKDRYMTMSASSQHKKEGFEKHHDDGKGEGGGGGGDDHHEDDDKHLKTDKKDEPRFQGDLNNRQYHNTVNYNNAYMEYKQRQEREERERQERLKEEEAKRKEEEAKAGKEIGNFAKDAGGDISKIFSKQGGSELKSLASAGANDVKKLFTKK